MQQFLGAFTAARVTYGGFYMLGAVGALFNVALRRTDRPDRRA